MNTNPCPIPSSPTQEPSGLAHHPTPHRALRRRARRWWAPLLAAVLLAPTVARTEEPAPPTLVVQPVKMPFELSSPWYRSPLGRGIQTLLITELSQQGRFQILESAELDDVNSENRLRNDSQQLAGADFLLATDLLEAGHANDTKKGQGPLSLPRIFIGRQHTTRVEMDWRLVQLPSRKIVATGHTVGEEVGKRSFWEANADPAHFQSQEFRDSAMGKALRKAIVAVATEVGHAKLPAAAPSQPLVTPKSTVPDPTLIESVTPAKAVVTAEVTATLPGGIVIVSAGRQQGLKVGDLLQVFELVELKDESGRVVFTQEKPVGNVVLDTVTEDQGKGLSTDAAAVKPGCRVKKT